MQRDASVTKHVHCLGLQYTIALAVDRDLDVTYRWELKQCARDLGMNLACTQ
jgi:hypothetical protein